MGGKQSCLSSSTSCDDEKAGKMKGPRPNDYTEIDDEFIASKKPTPGKNDRDITKTTNGTGSGDVEELYENSSSIMHATGLASQPHQQPQQPQTTTTITTQVKNPMKPSPNGKPPQIAPPPKPQIRPLSSYEDNSSKTSRSINAKVPHLMAATGGGNDMTDAATTATGTATTTSTGLSNPNKQQSKSHQQAPVSAFSLENTSETGRYQNVQPASFVIPPASVQPTTKPKPTKSRSKPAAKIRKQQNVQENEEENLYSEVHKPKSRIIGDSAQLNYVEVEISPPTVPSKAKDIEVIDTSTFYSQPAFTTTTTKRREPETAYTDVIQIDGKMVLVTPPKQCIS